MPVVRHPARNRQICDRYRSGTTVTAIAAEYCLTRARVYQILRAGGVSFSKPRSTNRQLGVWISAETFATIHARATACGWSRARVAAALIDRAIAQEAPCS